MSDGIVRRFLVQVDEHHWIMYDDEDDVKDWDDTVLEFSLPREVALMLDYTQHSYFQMQGYFAAQWEAMEKRVAQAASIPPEVPYDIDLQNHFEAIVKDLNLYTDEEEEE